MLDLVEKWPAVPDWSAAAIESPNFSIRTLSGLSQMLVSGDLDAWVRLCGIAPNGADRAATGDRYAVRLARDRSLAVSEKPLGIVPGWHVEGFAVSVADAGLHVFEIGGPKALEVMARATALDPDAGTRSAALLFAGINAFVYRHGGAGRIRVHVDRGLAPYLWQWFEQVCS